MGRRQGCIVLIADIDLPAQTVVGKVEMDVRLGKHLGRNVKAMGHVGADQQNIPCGAPVAGLVILQNELATFHVQQLIIQNDPPVDVQRRMNGGGRRVTNIRIDFMNIHAFSSPEQELLKIRTISTIANIPNI